MGEITNYAVEILKNKERFDCEFGVCVFLWNSYNKFRLINLKIKTVLLIELLNTTLHFTHTL